MIFFTIFGFLIFFIPYIDAYRTFYMEDHCIPGVVTEPFNITLEISGGNSSGILKASRNDIYARGLNCSVVILPPLEFGVIISIRSLNLALNSSCKDSLVIADAEHTFVKCGQKNLDPYEHESLTLFGPVTITFQTDRFIPVVFSSGFQLTFTAFFKPEGNSSCNDTDEYQCKNKLCVWSGLVCDGHNNCGDNSDEDLYGILTCSNNNGYFPITALFLFFFVLALCVISPVCFICYRRRKAAYSAVLLTSSASPYGSNVNYGTYTSGTVHVEDEFYQHPLQYAVYPYTETRTVSNVVHVVPQYDEKTVTNIIHLAPQYDEKTVTNVVRVVSQCDDKK